VVYATESHNDTRFGSLLKNEEVITPEQLQESMEACIFRQHSATHSGNTQPPIPVTLRHLFR